MPFPKRVQDESSIQFVLRCISDAEVKKEFPDEDQRVLACLKHSSANLSLIESMSLNIQLDELMASESNPSEYGFTEEITEDNFYVPSESEYESVAGETEEDCDISVANPELWENIRQKKEQAAFKYKHPKTGEIYEYQHRGIYKKDGTILIPVKASEYQGRKVTLNKPFLTPDGPKKRSVYVKNDKGNVVKVNFGDPNMKIKKSNPVRRKSFRARHNCDNPGPKWKARYWSCKSW